jgi:chromosomal replication initiator protein
MKRRWVDMDFDPGPKVWNGMLTHLRAHHPTICRQWFEDLEPAGVLGGALHVRAKSDLYRDYLRRMCADAFNDAARSASGRLLAIRFVGPNDPLPAAPKVKPSTKSADRARHEPLVVQTPSGSTSNHVPKVTPAAVSVPSAAAPRAPHVESLVVNPDYGFDTFVVGQENRLAHAAARSVASNPGRTYNPFFIHGGVGLGKTHLLQAICLELARTRPGISMLYISCEGFMSQFLECVQSGQMAEFRHRFRDVDVLVVDDIHFLADRDRTQEEFFHTFNALHQANKQIVLSSDAAPEEIPSIESRLVSRFKWGLVARIEPPCLETRMEILKAKARIRGLSMPDDVAEMIATRIDTNIRELEGAVVKLQIQSAVENRPIDLSLAAAALGDHVSPSQNGPTIQVIMGAVTEFYGLRIPDLQSKRRQRSIALPRQVCMYLARRNTKLSLEEIGGYFGGRDHTTVMHAVRTIEDRRSPESEIDQILKTIEERIRPRKAGAAAV